MKLLEAESARSGEPICGEGRLSERLAFQYMRAAILSGIADAASVSEVPDETWRPIISSRKFQFIRDAQTLYKNQCRSTFSVLLEILTDEERCSIFNGVFEIGNCHPVPQKLHSYAALEQDLGGVAKEGGSILRTVKRGLRDLLGHDSMHYLRIDPNTALKVMRLLYRYQVGLDGSSGCSKLFSYLKLPGIKRSSFEFRPPFQMAGAPRTGDAIDKQRIIDELTVLLGSELGLVLREEIRKTFMSIATDVGEAELVLRNRIRSTAKHSLNNCQSVSDKAIARIRGLRDMATSRSENQSLDLDLLIYICRAQVVNRNQAYVEVLDAITRCGWVVNSIEADLIAFNARFDRERVGRNINKVVTDAAGLQEFLSDHICHLKKLMSSAIGIDISAADYSLAVYNALRMITIECASNVQSSRMSLVDVVGYLCTLHIGVNDKFGARYSPYWRGQNKQSDRPFHHFRMSGVLNSQNVPEGTMIFWRESRRYVTHAILGQSEYWDLDGTIKREISGALAAIMASHDLPAIQNFAREISVIADEIPVEIA